MSQSLWVSWMRNHKMKRIVFSESLFLYSIFLQYTFNKMVPKGFNRVIHREFSTSLVQDVSKKHEMHFPQREWRPKGCKGCQLYRGTVWNSMEQTEKYSNFLFHVKNWVWSSGQCGNREDISMNQRYWIISWSIFKPKSRLVKNNYIYSDLFIKFCTKK